MFLTDVWKYLFQPWIWFYPDSTSSGNSNCVLARNFSVLSHWQLNLTTLSRHLSGPEWAHDLLGNNARSYSSVAEAMLPFQKRLMSSLCLCTPLVSSNFFYTLNCIVSQTDYLLFCCRIPSFKKKNTFNPKFFEEEPQMSLVILKRPVIN